MTERELFAALGVPYDAPAYERDGVERAFPSPADSGIIGAVGVSGNPSTICAASIGLLTPDGGRRLHLGSKSR